MISVLFVLATVLLIHVCHAIYNLSQCIVGVLLGTKVEVVQIGTNLFFKPFEFFYGETVVRFGVIPLNGFTTFFSGESDETRSLDGNSALSQRQHLSFTELSKGGRMLLLFSGPFNTIVFGLLLLCLPICLDGPQVGVADTAQSQIAVSSVPGLAVASSSSTVTGQRTLIQSTIFEFWRRLATGKSMKGWGGPFAWVVTCGYAGEISPLAWLSCASLILIASGMFNLAPLPILNGGRLLFVLCEFIFGRLPEPTEAKLAIFSLLVVIAFFCYVTILDILWFSSRFVM